MSRLDHAIRFRPLLKRAIWGGRRMETMLGKQLGEGDDFAESWEVVDHGQDQSVVESGPLAGATLAQLAAEYSEDLYGKGYEGAFPLLLKFLDCNRTLSVQVHPDDAQGALLDPPDLGKTEAWVVLAAEPGSLIYAGLREGVDAAELSRAVQVGECEQCLHQFEPQVGDCVFIRAGTVHALGAGLVIAEIQQASNTTFRLFDWNRVDAEGNPRQLHIEQSLETIDFSRGPVARQVPAKLSEARECLVDCDKFVLDRVKISSPTEIGGDGRFHILVGVKGEAVLKGQEFVPSVRPGQSALLPAATSEITLDADEDTVLLDIYLPS